MKHGPTEQPGYPQQAQPYQAYEGQGYGQPQDAPQYVPGHQAPPRGPQRPQARPRPPQRPRDPHPNLRMRQVGNDFRQLLNSYFSRQPTNVFKYDFSIWTYGILLLVNIFFYALTRLFISIRVYGQMGLPFGGLKQGAQILGYGMLGALLILAGTLLAMVLIAQLAGCERRPPLQYVKTLAAAAPPYNIMVVLALVIGLLRPSLGNAFLLMAPYVFAFTLYHGLKKNHNSRRMSLLWPFVLVFVVITLVVHFVP